MSYDKRIGPMKDHWSYHGHHEAEPLTPCRHGHRKCEDCDGGDWRYAEPTEKESTE